MIFGSVDMTVLVSILITWRAEYLLLISKYFKIKHFYMDQTQNARQVHSHSGSRNDT